MAFRLLSSFANVSCNLVTTMRIIHRPLSRICADDPGPRCSAKSPKGRVCTDLKRREEYGLNKKPPTSMWENPDCCKIPNCEQSVRYDDLYWKESDKVKRQYMRTWAECPNLKFEYVTICCPEREDIAEREYRPRKPKHDEKLCATKEPMKCKEKVGDCPKLKMPFCREVRENLRCTKVRRPSDCKKYCTPYPSYSECIKTKIKRLPLSECKCLDVPPMCEVHKYAEKLSKRQDAE